MIDPQDSSEAVNYINFELQVYQSVQTGQPAYYMFQGYELYIYPFHTEYAIRVQQLDVEKPRWVSRKNIYPYTIENFPQTVVDFNGPYPTYIYNGSFEARQIYSYLQGRTAQNWLGDPTSLQAKILELQMLKHAKLSQNYLIMIGLLLTGIYFQLRIFRSIICVHQKYFQLLPKTIALTIPYPFHSNIKRYTHFIISYFLYKSNELLFDYIDYKNKTFELMINEEMQETIRYLYAAKNLM